MIRNILVGLGLSVAVFSLFPSTAKADILVNTFCQLNNDDVLYEDRYFDVYYFDALKGEPITVLMSSAEFDTLVRVVDANGDIVFENDDMDETTGNSLISAQIPADGGYAIVATAYHPIGEGSYHLVAGTNSNASMDTIFQEYQVAVAC